MIKDVAYDAIIKEFIAKAVEIERNSINSVIKESDAKIIDQLAQEFERILEKYED